MRTNAVHVGLDSTCHLEIDDQADVLHVDTSPGKISCNEDVRVVVAEGRERSFSLFLIFARMEGGGAPL
jgi:hypothetical protein